MNIDAFWQYTELVDFLALLRGTILTAKITLLSAFLGAMLGLFVGMARFWRRKPFSWLCDLFCFYFRGTPLLLQMFMIYYGSGQFSRQLGNIGLWHIFSSAFFCAVLALTLNSAAYMAEIFRGALAAVSKGQYEASESLGFKRRDAFRLIIFPQMLRIALPPLGNEFIFLFQATSLVSIISVMDLTAEARVTASRTFAVYQNYAAAAAIYLALTYLIVLLLRRLEIKLSIPGRS